MSFTGPSPRHVLTTAGFVGKLIGLAVVAGLLVGVVLIPTMGGFGLMAKATADQTKPVKLDEPDLPQISTIRASDGSVIAQFYYENRTDVTIDKIAPIMRKAIVAIEDSRFYQHGPIDVQGTLRALIRNKTSSGGSVQGGSSLTQQYVKNVLFEKAGTLVTVAESKLAQARTKAAKEQAQKDLKAAQDAQNNTIAPTFSRKIQELKYALWVEQNYSKDQILAKYLNIAYFGHHTYGIEAAAERYFSVHASQLTLPQAAMLAGMVNNANKYDPQGNAANVKWTLERRGQVIDAMLKQGDITKEQADQVNAQKTLGLRPTVNGGGCSANTVQYGNFCRYVQDEILSNPVFGSTSDARRILLETGGLDIKTTLVPHAQDAAQRAVDDSDSAKSSKVSAVAVVEPGTGKIISMAQSRPYGLGKHQTTINFTADQAHGGGMGLQAGSTFKVFTLAAALKYGYKLSQMYPTPTSISLSGFRDCKGESLGSWDNLHNAESSKATSQDMAYATWHSTNTYFAQLERDVGVCKVARVAADFGMTLTDGSPLHQLPSFTLGANEIDLIHEAAAYAGFAADGKYCSPIAITSMRKVATGDQLQVPSANCHQAIDADVARAVNQTLRGVITQGTAASYGGIPGRTAAGKTGTTDGERTALFAGYTPNMAAVAWRGDPDAPFADPVGAFGASTIPIWRPAMEGALEGLPVESFDSPNRSFGSGGQATVPNASPSPNPGNGKGKGKGKGHGRGGGTLPTPVTTP